jgi:hypothetical protein
MEESGRRGRSSILGVRWDLSTFCKWVLISLNDPMNFLSERKNFRLDIALKNLYASGIQRTLNCIPDVHRT